MMRWLAQPLGTTLLLGASLVLAGAGGLRAQTALPQNPETPALVSELTAIVTQHGWPANMGRMCPALKLGSDSGCMFTQIALSGSEPGVIDNYGFNVPAENSGARPYVLLFHLGPLVANFFVVAPDGTLLSSFYRAKGVDYAEIPTRDAAKAFATSVSFWAQGLPKLKEMIAAGNIPRR